MDNFNFECPYNSLSFGFVSQAISREFYKRGLQPNIFTTGGNIDLSAYKVEEDYGNWLKSCIGKSAKQYNKHQPVFRVWHLAGSEHQVGNKSLLNTYHECSQLTELEANIARNQDKLLLTSQYSIDVFKNAGVENTRYLPLGFDNVHFFDTKKTYLKDIIVFYINGKCEPVRKAHKKVIQAWVKKYGNNRSYALHLSIQNPFLDQNAHNTILGDIFNNQKPPFNINILPHVSTLESLNQCYNACNIVIDCGTESWALPSFHCTALGKHAVIGNWGGLKSWANEKNAVLIESNGMKDAEDGMFFKRGAEINQGQFFDFAEDDFLSACEQAEKRYLAQPVNTEGLKLQEMTWAKTTDIILEELQKLQ